MKERDTCRSSEGASKPRMYVPFCKNSKMIPVARVAKIKLRRADETIKETDPVRPCKLL
jgi:hypothetical protein